MKYDDEYDYDGEDEGGSYRVTSRRIHITIIPRFLSLGMMASRTDAGSTSLAIVIFVWKVSTTLSIQTYA